MNIRKIGGGRYEIYDDEVLGEGSFGKVHLGQTSPGPGSGITPLGESAHRTGNEKVAIETR